MTWEAFKTLVNGLIAYDKRRGGIEEYRENVIRQGVIRLQSLVPGFRVGHENIYRPVNDLTTVGYASTGTKPPESVITNVTLARMVTVDDETECQRITAVPFPYGDREALIQGWMPVNDGQARYAIDNLGYTFFVYPEVKDEWILSLTWNGLKLDFEDRDETPFTEKAAGIVAEFLQAYIARKIDRDIGMHDSFMKSFDRGVRMAFVDHKAQGGSNS